MNDPGAALDCSDPAKSNQAGLSQRLLSLDTYRGLIMCTLAANGLALAATANKLGYGVEVEVTSSVGQTWQWLAFHNSHPFWNSQFHVFGCSYWDLIQPSFMFMVGVAMPYSYASRRKRGDSTAKLTTHALVRALVLIALGVFLQTRSTGLESNRLFTNVLAQIGLGYFFVFLLLGRGVRLQISVAAIVLAGYWAWFVQFQVPDPLPKPAAESIETLPTRPRFAKHFALNTNPASEFDVMLFNALPHHKPIKAHAAGYTTLNFIPSAVTILFGVMAGTLLRGRRNPYDKLRFLLGSGLFCMLLAVALSYTCCPIVKKIWTPAWTLYSGAWVLWILGALYWIVDIRGWKAWTFPLVIVGMNSLAIYLMSMLLKRSVSDGLQTYLGDQIFSGPYGPTIQAAAVFVVFWLTCLYLYRSKIFFRV